MLSKNVTKKIMRNGATLLVREDHSLPVVSIVVYVKCGYLHESDQEIGLAHVVEHTLVSGNGRKQANEFIHKVRELGGSLHASTSYMHTCYSAVLPSNNWSNGVELMARMLQKPAFSSSVLQREIEIILHEMRGKYDSPGQMGKERLYELAFENHRIRRWRLGSEKQLRAITVSDLDAFYSKHYHPGNLVWAIVGNVEADRVFAKADKYFLPSNRPIAASEPQPVDPPQNSFRYRHVHSDYNKAYLLIGFRIENQLTIDEVIALENLTVILGQGGGKYFYRNRRDLAGMLHSISATHISYGQARMFLIEAECDPENVEKACKVIFKAISDIQQGDISEQEVVRARHLLECRHLYSLQLFKNQAWMLACCEADGDYTMIDNYPQRLANVTAIDIARVAANLSINCCNLLMSVSRHVQISSPDAWNLSSLLGNSTHRQADELQNPAHARKPLSHKTAGPSTGNRISVHHRILDGMILIVKENPALPLVSCGIFTKKKVYETAHNAGISEFMLRNVLASHSEISASGIHFEIEKLGGQLKRWSERDGMGCVVDVLRRNFDAAFEILSRAVMSPVFIEHSVEKEKAKLLAHIKTSPPSLIDLVHSTLFDGHPYGLPRYGYSETVRSFTRDQVQEWYQKHFSKRNLLYVFAGDITVERALEAVGTCFDKLTHCYSSTSDIPALPKHATIQKRVEQSDFAQTHLSIGFRAPGYTDPLFPAFMILESLLAGNGGRLVEKLRRKGLAYSANGTYLFYRHSGAFLFNVSTLPRCEEKVIDELLEEFENPGVLDFDKEEFRIATDQVIGQYRVSQQTNAMQLFRFAHNEILGGSIDEVTEFPDRLSKVTVSEIIEAVQQYFDTKSYALAVLRGKGANKESKR